MSNASLKVAFFLPGLHGGGAERVALNLLQGMVDQGYQPDLLVGQLEGDMAEQVPTGVNTINLQKPRVIACVPALARYLREERPDALVAHIFHSNLAAILAGKMAKGSTRIIGVEHNAMGKALSQSFKTRVVKQVMKLLYPGADIIVGVSDGVCRDICESLGVAEEKVLTIYNPVVNDALLLKAEEIPDHPWIDSDQPLFLGLGRLAPEKDFPNLLQAFAEFRKSREGKLLILGEGALRAQLEDQIEELGIGDDVEMPGFCQNPYGYLSKATALVLSSEWEGLPTVLIEALACGCPVVSTDCPMGPDEILEGGKYGPLVPMKDPVALAKAMIEITDNPPNRDLLRERGAWYSYKRSVDRYLKVCRGEEIAPRQSEDS